MLHGTFAAFVKDVWTESLSEPVTVYNFEVAVSHTYFVSDRNVLVHNKCGNVGSGELSDDALRNIGRPGKNKGFRVLDGTHDDAMNFVKSQTTNLNEIAPGKFMGTNSRGTIFTVYKQLTPKSFSKPYTSIRINGIKGLNGIKFIWP